jgi:hypothetical protein
MGNGCDAAQQHSWLKNIFSEYELHEMRVLEPGDKLTAGETYFDLTYPEGQPMIATSSNQRVPENSLFAARTGTRPRVWQRLISHRSRGTRTGNFEEPPHSTH